MDINIKALGELIPGLTDYPWWVKPLVLITLLLVFDLYFDFHLCA